eukprot:349776-Chlamydomonas_euryale.AAC.2
MATMLGVVTCDASVDAEVWQGMVKRASVASFNQVWVPVWARAQAQVWARVWALGAGRAVQRAATLDTSRACPHLLRACDA